MKKLTEIMLKYLAKRIIAAYQPLVIGITGSVGKTSTREAVYSVIKAQLPARPSAKNYNNELGLPLTVIGADSPGTSLIGWLRVLAAGARLARGKAVDYPKALVLEMAVDRPGDMDYLLSIVRPSIGIMTYAGTVHVEHFADREALRAEKAKLLAALPPDGLAVVNHDNEGSRRSAKAGPARSVSYGLGEGADVVAREIRPSYRGAQIAQNLLGTSFKLCHGGACAPVLLPGVLGAGAVYAALAGAAVGLARGMDLAQAAEALGSFIPPKGRMRLVAGVKGAMIIDDTYNAEPGSTRAAIAALDGIGVGPGAKRYAILGDMLELGAYSEEEHRTVGRDLAKGGIYALVTVGERSRDIARGAKAAGMPEERCFHFPDPLSAGRFIQDRLKPGDAVLCKGSQGLRLEKAVLELMAEPLRAKELLVRQGKGWE